MGASEERLRLDQEMVPVCVLMDMVSPVLFMAGITNSVRSLGWPP